jgi:hypothetical protein
LGGRLKTTFKKGCAKERNQFSPEVWLALFKKVPQNYNTTVRARFGSHFSKKCRKTLGYEF